MNPIAIETFCHVTLHVNDLETTLAFYKDLLGLTVLFDLDLAGAGLDAITGNKDAAGRMVGLGVTVGTMIELVKGVPRPAGKGPVEGHGDSLIFSLAVADVDTTYAAIEAAGIETLQTPTEIHGVRMFFARDPDGRRIEFAEYPGDATRAAEMYGFPRP